jgi:hypothetical protein
LSRVDLLGKDHQQFAQYLDSYSATGLYLDLTSQVRIVISLNVDTFIESLSLSVSIIDTYIFWSRRSILEELSSYVVSDFGQYLES